MLRLGFASLIALVAAFAATAPGCSTVENAYNCQQICDRYKDCFDASYDSGACQDRCKSKAKDDGFANKASDCQSCIDDKSCTGSFACIAECGGIVP